MAVGERQDSDVMPTPTNELMVISKADEADLKGVNSCMAGVVRKMFFLRVMVGWLIFVNRVRGCFIVNNLLIK